MLSYNKRISKLENYWLFNSDFREKMYACVSSKDSTASVYVKQFYCTEIGKSYSDLDLSTNEISVFFSGFFFNSNSQYERYDANYNHLSEPEIKQKNFDFNKLGKITGCAGAIKYLFDLVYREENNLNTEFIFKRMKDKFSHLTRMEINSFLLGRKEALFGEIQNRTKTEQFFYSAGIDSKNQTLLKNFKSMNFFEDKK